MNGKLTITEENGETVVADIISFFTINETGLKYAIYTFNEIDSNGLIKLHVSRAVEENGNYTLENIEDENEWTMVKNEMKDIIAGGAN